MPVSPLRLFSVALVAALTLCFATMAQAAHRASAHSAAAKKCRSTRSHGRLKKRCSTTKRRSTKRRASTTDTTPVSSFEAEGMTRSSSDVVVVNDSTASAGKALRFSGNAYAYTTKTVDAANGLDIRARGDQCSGAPNMAVSVDGHLVSNLPVSTTSWGSYKVSTSMSAGSHKVTVAFTNDKRVTGVCDRNLRVDKVTVTNTITAPVTAPTPVPTTPTPTSPTPTVSQLTIALASGDPSRVAFTMPTGTAKVHIYESDGATYPAAAGTYDYKDISAATAASPWQPSRQYVDAEALDSSGKEIGTWFSSSTGGSRVKVTLATTTTPPPTTTTTTTTTTPTPPPTTTTTTTTTTTPTPPPTTTTTTTTTTTSTPTPPPSPTGFTVGMVSGPAAGWEAGLVSALDLHPKVVRIPFDIGTSASTVQNAVAALAAKGEQAQPLAEFYGTIPSTSAAQNLATWAHAVGPGGTFWQGRSDGNLAVQFIEFGNETNESYQFGGVASGPSYISRAQSYALRARDAITAIDSPSGNSNVGLIVQGDNGGCGCSQWVDGMFSAVPDLNKRIAGWTIHPYGPKSRYGPIINQAVNDTAKHGDTTLPFFITEYGISTDNGTCLTSNYNWPTCLTFQQAADDLHGAIADLRQTYGSRLAQLLIFEQRDMKASGSTNDREGFFGALHTDGSAKGAFTTEIRNLLNTYRG
jgi:hypothetical protein